MNYRSLSDYLKEEFGTKVYKLSLQTGCSCPNRDGTLSYGGCTFCSEGGSGDFAAPLLPIREQIRIARSLVDPKIPARIPENARKYIAYFQSYTNTYGDPDRLLPLFEEALRFPEIAALSIGTRPDCLAPGMLAGLKQLRHTPFPSRPLPSSLGNAGSPHAETTQEKPIWVELGLQTIHEKTARRIHRGYDLRCFLDSYARLKEAGLAVIVHVILGLPGESEADMLETVRFLADLTPRIDGIKLQLLHVLRGTQLAREYETLPFPIFSLEEYCDLVVSCLQILPPEVVVHRLTGDGPKKLLVAPLWSADKKRVLNTLQRKIREA